MSLSLSLSLSLSHMQVVSPCENGQSTVSYIPSNYPNRCHHGHESLPPTIMSCNPVAHNCSGLLQSLFLLFLSTLSLSYSPLPPPLIFELFSSEFIRIAGTYFPLLSPPDGECVNVSPGFFSFFFSHGLFLTRNRLFFRRWSHLFGSL
jgi:hypothetical protein